MGIKVKINPKEIERRMQNFLVALEDEQIRLLQELGEECVTKARSITPAQGGFNDQTGNLRSSIGYVIFQDGVPLRSSYVQVLEGEKGVKAGQELAEAVAKDTQGLALVVTAGMHYALAVESKGRDVLTSAELLAKNRLPEMLQALAEDIRTASQG